MSREPIILRDDVVRGYVLDLIGKLNLEKPWAVTVEPYKKKRSLNQLGLYWKWVGIVANETGNDADDLHEFFKSKFLIPRPVEIGGEVINVRSTTKLDTAAMKEFMDRVYAFAGSELGIMLPVPEDMGRAA